MGNRIVNTREKEARPEWLFGGNPGAIEQQEFEGQMQLNASEVLPTDCRPNRAAYEAMGIVFGEPAKGDNLFTNVTLPAGWKKRPTDHSMWSELVDDAGTVRAMIFYKAAFYDRQAFIAVS